MAKWAAGRVHRNRTCGFPISVLRKERAIMGRKKWITSGVLLLSLSAAAQQPANSPANTQATAVTDQSAQAAAPVTMDQVVDRVVEREHYLIKMLETRTPVVETNLQTLRLNPRL